VEFEGMGLTSVGEIRVVGFLDHTKPGAVRLDTMIGNHRQSIEVFRSLEISSLGRYQIRGRIGRGTMGIVYRGYDPVLAREIALKTVDLSPALAAPQREAFLARFFQEARIAAKLLHPNIVVTHDAATDDKTSVPFIAMELVTGGSLADRIERDGRLSWEEASRLVVLLARALDFAHGEGVVHRDVKPANVLLTPEGAPKIADFGIAKLEDTHLTQTGAVIGTPYFMSPEQLEADEVDGRSDLFSLGSLLYAALAGRPPFVGADLSAITRQVLFKNPEPLSEVVTGIPRSLDGVLARALAKDPKDRYANGAELAHDLERVIRGEAPLRPLALGERTAESPKAAPAVPDPVHERPRRSGWGAFLMLLVAGLGGYGAFAHWEEAEEVLRQNRELAKLREELAAKAATRLTEAREGAARAHWDEAARRIEESLALSREGGDGAGEAEALLVRGILRAESGEWSKARADLDSAASVFEIYGVPEGKRRALLERANLERDLGAFERAEALYDELKGEDAALEKALLALMRNDAASAERGFRAAHESGNREEIRARAALYLGILASGRGEAEDAERLWNEARGKAGSGEVDRFLGEPGTKRSEERRSRLPGAVPR
jgi:tetratricopeptide (TPR) repeat protein